MKKLIISFNSSYRQYTVNEINNLCRQITKENFIISDLSSDVIVLEFSGIVNYMEFSELVRSSTCAFIRHICPVDFETDNYLDMAAKALPYCDTELTFSIQTRCLTEEHKTSPSEINKFTAGELIKNGFTLNVKNPEQVISIVTNDEVYYVGISNARLNLSNWPGGIRHFAVEKEQISRSEFKLLEALEVFEIDTDNFKTALDLGAAPGGWTRMLTKRGINVAAVDPSKLDARISNNKNVKVFQEKAEVYLLKNVNAKFDIIVNDMRMDSNDSCRLMNEASHYLSSDGYGIITLKLIPEKLMKQIGKSLEILRNKYDIVGVRQLFHNRNEVTVAVKRK